MLDKFFILLHADYRLIYIYMDCVKYAHAAFTSLVRKHSKISPGTLLHYYLCLCLRYYTTLIC